jgi:hypothetical protein
MLGRDTDGGAAAQAFEGVLNEEASGVPAAARAYKAVHKQHCGCGAPR